MVKTTVVSSCGNGGREMRDVYILGARCVCVKFSPYWLKVVQKRDARGSERLSPPMLRPAL